MTKVIQYHSSILRSDAIGTSITLLHKALLERNVASFISCADSQLESSLPGVVPASSLLNAQMGKSLAQRDIIIIHYSYLDATAEALSHLPLRRIIVYHNITPGKFFREAGLDWLADGCDSGREQLRRMAPAFDIAVGDSDFNSAELQESGYKNVRTIPVLSDYSGFRRGKVETELFYKLRDQCEVNLLFVGRFVPNKRIDRLISLVSEFKKRFPLSIRLHIVGKIWNEAYYVSLIKHASELNVAQNIQIHIDVDADRLRTLYAAASAFVSMSDHEGFMVPLIEAFASGCPVIAANAGAIGETMGGAGLLMSAPDPSFAASLVYMLSTDQEFRYNTIARQAQRAAHFSQLRVTKKWLDTIEGMPAHL
ncbi:Glycosyltransferase involved in cell wall bisynthesis [Methylobacterium sp. 13MFTsu3.1M2]|nr:Glycosyltransferase involved in cell wall bisynthesis [Methylobacterium sp. 13MFTsu3.1M2]